MSWSKYRIAGMPVKMLDQMGLRIGGGPEIRFVIERGNWSIKWDGTYITQEVDKIAPGRIRLETAPHLLAGKIVHYGSQYQWTAWNRHVAESNRNICTFFHGKREDDAAMARHVDEFLESVPRLEKVITAAALIEDRLLGWGVPREKLVRIPIGVDCAMFRPADDAARAAMRASYGIRDDQLVIGSFQKDGVGWGEGMEPKYIKGPDLLLQTVEKVAKERPVFVLLTGPARGYVIHGLRERGIPFAHEYLDDYLQLAPRFAALDVYMNPSREEGGPKGILEAMAAGVLVASTKVGMAPDVIRHRENGILCDVGDTETMAAAILNAAAEPDKSRAMTGQARRDIMALDWAEIGRMHYDLVYKDMLRP